MSIVKPIVLARLAVIVFGLYFCSAIYVLRFQLDHFLFPYKEVANGVNPKNAISVIGPNGNGILIRHYGSPRLGCILFFPGQHGGIKSYEDNLFPSYVASGIAVYAISYPGQDGAKGRSNIQDIQSLSLKAIDTIRDVCPLNKTVFVGRSLGAMIAAYAAGVSNPVGLVLEGAAPSLSSGVIAYMSNRWYLSPITLLPLHVVLSHDYSLSEALPTLPKFPIIVFQGAKDDQTPVDALQSSKKLPRNTQLVVVPNGTHANTYQLIISQYVQSIFSMLKSPTK